MIQCRQVRFAYPGESFQLALDDLRIESGESVAVTGPSGCGKTTLLRLIAGILFPQSGKITVDETEVTSLSEEQRRAFRLTSMGLVFQEFELLDYLTVKENVEIPFQLQPLERSSATPLLERAGIAHLAGRYPHEISQGERQRVAICRAMITRPRVILADEPTGNLDPKNKGRLTSLLREEAKSSDATLVMVTHDLANLADFDREIHLGALLEGGDS